ncbi:metal-dependent phosphohydrolase [Pelomyxa schiedti]|nr:metal-dependent phosphohydrolase [Pelomyxa schiedti]
MASLPTPATSGDPVPTKQSSGLGSLLKTSSTSSLLSTATQTTPRSGGDGSAVAATTTTPPGTCDVCSSGGAPFAEMPSVERCKRILDENSVKINVKEHSMTVMRVAMRIATNLAPAAQHINTQLVTAGSVLHDITKSRSLQTGERHEVTGGALVRSLGYPSVACCVEQHLFINNFLENSPLREEEIVCYADKRVLHTQVVSLSARMIDAVKRAYQQPLLNSGGFTAPDTIGDPSATRCNILDAKAIARAASVVDTFQNLYEPLQRKIQANITGSLEELIGGGSNTREALFPWKYGGTEILVAGDFSDWYPIPCRKGNSLRLFLPPGVYSYKFVVDGKWVFDMEKPTTTDPLGNTNNILTLR